MLSSWKHLSHLEDQENNLPFKQRNRDNCSSSDVKLASDQCAPSAKQDLVLDDLKRSLTCGICNGWIASSLVLSCGHVFCGHCLFLHLSCKPSCPTCQVSLRSIPMRCLALDGVGSSLQPLLSKHELESFQKREEEGKAAANKVNKMFWWLAPTKVPVTTEQSGQSGMKMAHNPEPPTNYSNSGLWKSKSQPQHMNYPPRHRSRDVPSSGLLPSSLSQPLPEQYSSADFRNASSLFHATSTKPSMSPYGSGSFGPLGDLTNDLWSQQLIDPQLGLFPDAQLQLLLQQLYIQGNLS